MASIGYVRVLLVASPFVGWWSVLLALIVSRGSLLTYDTSNNIARRNCTCPSATVLSSLRTPQLLLCPLVEACMEMCREQDSPPLELSRSTQEVR